MNKEGEKNGFEVVDTRSPLETGNIEAWMNKSQWFIFRSLITGKLLATHTSALINILPVAIRANFEAGFNIAESTAETWILEWIDGEYRQCRIRALNATKNYWRFIPKADIDIKDRLILETFPQLNENGDRCLHVNGKVFFPSIFYIVIVESKIAIQHVPSQLWLSVSDRSGCIVGREDFSDACHFDMGIKVGIYYNNRANIRKFLATSAPLVGLNRIINNCFLVRRKQTFFMFFEGNYFLLFSPTAGKFLSIEQNRLGANANDIQSAIKFRLDGGCPWWDIYATLSSSDDSYIRLFQWENGILTATEVYNKNPIEIEKSRSLSSFQFLCLPENGMDLFDNDECLAPAEIMKRERGLVFGIVTDKVICNSSSEAMVFFSESIEYIRDYLHSEGLFRISGNVLNVKALRHNLNVGTALRNAILLLQTEGIFINIDDVCSVFKLFLRTMNPPLIPDDLLTLLIEENESDKDSEVFSVPSASSGGEVIQYTEEQFNRYKTIINSKLSKPRRSILSRLCKFMSDIAERCAENKMTVSNLAVVIAPNLISPNVASPVSWRFVFSVLVTEHEKIFSLPQPRHK